MAATILALLVYGVVIVTFAQSLVTMVRMWKYLRVRVPAIAAVVAGFVVVLLPTLLYSSAPPSPLNNVEFVMAQGFLTFLIGPVHLILFAWLTERVKKPGEPTPEIPTPSLAPVSKPSDFGSFPHFPK